MLVSPRRGHPESFSPIGINFNKNSDLGPKKNVLKKACSTHIFSGRFFGNFDKILVIENFCRTSVFFFKFLTLKIWPYFWKGYFWTRFFCVAE